jgi:hypothetical protein
VKSFGITEPSNLIPAKNPLRASNGLPGSFGGTDTAERPLSNHFPLELSNACEYLEHQAAGRIRLVRIQSLRDGDEPADTVGIESGQLLVQVENRATKAVNLVDGHATELVLGGIRHEPIQCGATGLRTTIFLSNRWGPPQPSRK